MTPQSESAMSYDVLTVEMLDEADYCIAHGHPLSLELGRRLIAAARKWIEYQENALCTCVLHPNPAPTQREEADFAYMNEAARDMEAEEIARAQLREGNAAARAEAKRQGVKPLSECDTVGASTMPQKLRAVSWTDTQDCGLLDKAADIIERQDNLLWSLYLSWFLAFLLGTATGGAIQMALEKWGNACSPSVIATTYIAPSTKPVSGLEFLTMAPMPSGDIPLQLGSSVKASLLSSSQTQEDGRL